MSVAKRDAFGLVKTLMDAHTMGVHAAAALLRDCGYRVLISPPEVMEAMGRIGEESGQRVVIDWVVANGVTRVGFSYRLDPDDAVDLMGRLVHSLRRERLYDCDGAQVRSLFFAGLGPACDRVERAYGGRVRTFRGGESAEETLLVMGVPPEEIPRQITEGCAYDKELAKFGRDLVESGDYRRISAPARNPYPEYGTRSDGLELRLDHNYAGGFRPVIRAHSGPYSPDMSRLEMLREYRGWCRRLARSGFLDVLSIGSSQLSQSSFGEDWGGAPNGGGVPVNSEEEYSEIWEAARPMLVRTYSGTKGLVRLAGVYERSINIAWHALSLWWFDELDGRGPNALYDNLREHLDTIRWVATTGKPVETNVPHHFAFRGADDVTYVVSGYLAAKAAKLCGTRTFVLQNMLNTPRGTWGVQDLAKGRALLRLVRGLEGPDFRVILQARAGLDYFKPDLETAKAQLASVTAMMDDLEPGNPRSPGIIHVVSYSEALFLATPDVLDDSIRITRAALGEHRRLRRMGMAPDVSTDDVRSRQEALEGAARRVVAAMEEHIPDLYSPEGLYLAFVAGWLPTPELWSDSEEFRHAKAWATRMASGSVVLCDGDVMVTTDQRINRCVSNMPDAEYILRHKYGRCTAISK